MLTDTQVVSKIKSAFAPLHCGTEVYDYGARVRFGIFDGGRLVFQREGMLLRWLRREPLFDDIMQEVRHCVRKKGYQLN
jgi:hypothetical protein